MNKFVARMLELGAELDKAVSPIEISMVINDAEILYKNHKEKERILQIEQLTSTNVSERKLPHWARPLIAIVTMSLSTLFVIYRVFYVC